MKVYQNKNQHCFLIRLDSGAVTYRYGNMKTIQLTRTVDRDILIYQEVK